MSLPDTDATARFETIERAVELRLQRIEDKVDQLTEVVAQLARIEERVATVFRMHDAAAQTVATLTARIVALETLAAKNGTSIAIAERIVWLLFSLLAPVLTGVVVFYITKGGAP